MNQLKKQIHSVMKRMTAMALCSSMAVAMTGCVDQHAGSTTTTDTIDSSRIVATSVAVCNILDALEVDSVVGVPESSTYTIPERYEEATKIGSPMSPDTETLSALSPTLILSPDSLEGDLQPKYEAVGADSAFLNLTSVNGMFKSIEELGTLLDREEQADALVQDFTDYIKSYSDKNADKEAPTVLILMGLPGSYVVATSSSYAGNLVELAGGVNVYGDGDGEAFLNVNTEDMLEKAPDIILRTAHAMPEQVMEMFQEEFSTNEIWQHFEAVQNNQVYNLDYNKFGMSAGFNYKEALDDLQEILYDQE